jgi:hypothetical protein
MLVMLSELKASLNPESVRGQLLFDAITIRDFSTSLEMTET